VKTNLLESSASGVATSDLDGIITYVNPAFCRLLGVTDSSTVLGRPAADVLLQPDLVPHIIETVKAQQTWQGEIHGRRCDGSAVWAQVVCNLIYDDEGQPTGIMTSSADITERKLAERALRQGERDYRELVQNANSIILRMDRQGRLLFVNDFGRHFFGYTEQELLGKPVMETIVPEVDQEGASVPDMVARVLADPATYSSSENENITRDGRRVWVSWTNRALLDERGEIAEILSIGNDITPRKRMEKQLRISEAAIESSISAIGIADLDGTIRSVNAAYLRLWCYDDPSDIVGRSIGEFMPPSEAAEISAAIARDGHWVGERLAHRKDGSPFDIQVSANLVTDENKRPLCLMASFVDISKRMQAERELRQFKTISDRANYGHAILDMTGRMVYCNGTFASLHGYQVEALVGQPVSMLHTPEQWEEGRRLARKLTAEGELVAEKLWHSRQDGSVFPALVNVQIVRDEDGTPLMLSASIVDISDLTDAIDALEAERERLAVTLRSISDGVIATDMHGRISLLNPQAEAFTGWSQQEAMGREAAEVYRASAVDGRRSDPIAEVLAAGEALKEPESVSLVSRDGAERLVSQGASPLCDADGDMVGVVLVFRDVTEQERLREEVYQAHKLESLGVLAGGIAHDFNNLLTSLVGQINLARQAVRAPEVTAELLAAERAAMQARHLSQQLLTFSRGGAPVKTPLSLGWLIEDAMEFSLSGSKVAADLDLEAGLWPVEADEGQIRQVVSNLTLNAIQATCGAGRIRVRARNVQDPPVASLPPGRYVQVEVQDHGSGLPQDIVDKIFDPYFTTKRNGTGLGLTIAYSIIRKHGGQIAAHSEPGQGSTFSFHLPATDKPLPVADVDPPLTAAASARVLVMDDDAFIRKVISAMLKQLGYEAEVVSESQGAVQQFAQALADGRPFDAVVLDLTIKGGEGGIETLRKIREIHPQATVLACSGYCNDPAMAHYSDYGFDGVIVKPYRLQDLAEALGAVLGKAESGDDQATVA
jgi:PAS domain S-box-containing protein